jgi:hypothetical protein
LTDQVSGRRVDSGNGNFELGVFITAVVVLVTLMVAGVYLGSLEEEEQRAFMRACIENNSEENCLGKWRWR